jgi:hypothetical protein
MLPSRSKRKNMANKYELIEKLKKVDCKDFSFIIEEIDDFNFSEYFKDNFSIEKKAVLGLDIYKYSEYEENKQNLIPFIFDLLFDEAIDLLLKTEKGLFSDHNPNIRENFIGAGDGGYIIFQTPLHALIFNFIFYAELHLFNTGHLYPKLSKYIEGIFIRSSITYDNIYKYAESFYGKAIINNARILSKDKLNRFIIDKNTFDYFNKYYNGIESISIINKEVVKQQLNIKKEKFDTFFLIGTIQSIQAPIKSIHVQKLDELLSKNTKLIIYNIEVQLCLAIKKNNEGKSEISTEFIYTIGNTNITSLL